MSYSDVLRKRRSVYALSDKLDVPEEEIVQLVENAVVESPTAFNMQSSRAVVLFGEEHRRLWQITADVLKERIPAEQFRATDQKLKGFAAGAGSILFFENEAIVDAMKKQYALYASAFDMFAAHGLGILQGNVWNALAEKNIGANLQHYNPLIDERVRDQWDIPQEWRLVSQMVFGAVESRPDPVAKLPAEERVRVFR